MCCYIPNTPFGDPEFKKSSEKTFTDCYLMRGFVGGQWGYVLDGNDTNGVETNGRDVSEANALQDGIPGILKEEERRLAVYYLGWESTEVRSPTYRFHKPISLLDVSLICQMGLTWLCFGSSSFTKPPPRRHYSPKRSISSRPTSDQEPGRSMSHSPNTSEEGFDSTQMIPRPGAAKH